MQLQSIDKATYRQRLNKLIGGCVVLFATLGIGLSALLIDWFGAEQGQNFWWNVTGVAIAVFVVGSLLQHCRKQDWCREIDYVWTLKHELNLITRKFRALKAAAKQNDRDALIVLLFSYEGSKQLWLLDDNDLNLAELNQDLALLQAQIASLPFSVELGDYHRDLLNKF